MPLRPGPRHSGLLALAVMAAKVALSLPRFGDSSPAAVLIVITWATVAAFLVIGLVLFRTSVPPANAWACIAVAAATVPGDLAEPFYAHWWLTPLGYVLEQLYLAAAVALVLRYPADRLQHRDRVAVALIAVAAVGLRIPLIFTAGHLNDGFHRPPGWPVVVRSDLVHDWLLLRGGLLLTTVGLVWAVTRLAQRALGARGLARQALLPVTATGLFAALFAALDRLSHLSPQLDPLSWVPAMLRDLSAAGIPVALIGNLLRRRAAGAAIALQVVAAAQSGKPAALRDALADALADPSVELWFAAGTGGWVTVDGASAAAPGPREGRRLAQVLDGAGQPLCVVSVDARVVHDEQLFQSALGAIRLGVENDRLRAQLLLRMAEIEESRERIVEAGAAERRRVERDLHDGAQQQLLAVAASLARAGLVQDPAEVRDAVTGARAQLVEALAELRRLARGIHPAALSQGGLEAALPGLGETAAVPTRVVLGDDLRGRRFKASVESTTYYVVAEALTNIVRHADATRAEVTVDLRDGSDAASGSPCLLIRVVDDGRGGATLSPGGGLAGLRDRIQALGGTLDVRAGSGGRGTVLRAAVPAGTESPS